MKVYVSSPVSIPQKDLDAVLELLNKFDGIQAYSWLRGAPYHTRLLDEADAVVVILPDFNWKHSRLSLPNGVKNEISRAKSQAKPIYLAYVPTSINAGEMSIYKTTIDSGMFSGIPGTSGTLFKDYNIKEVTKDVVKKRTIVDIISDNPSTIVILDDPKSDKRLLLLVKSIK